MLGSGRNLLALRLTTSGRKRSQTRTGKRQARLPVFLSPFWPETVSRSVQGFGDSVPESSLRSPSLESARYLLN
jgi:hypothetical protein